MLINIRDFAFGSSIFQPFHERASSQVAFPLKTHLSSVLCTVTAMNSQSYSPGSWRLQISSLAMYKYFPCVFSLCDSLGQDNFHCAILRLESLTDGEGHSWRVNLAATFHRQALKPTPPSPSTPPFSLLRPRVLSPRLATFNSYILIFFAVIFFLSVCSFLVYLPLSQKYASERMFS